MRIDYPQNHQIDDLRRLWTEAFGDTEAYLDAFFYRVFSPDRCRCVMVDGRVAAALYWLDCRHMDRPVAYLYAVATGKAYRGRGLCRALMADTHRLLAGLGYAGCLLVPGEESLFQMYGAMGYAVSSTICQWSAEAGDQSVDLRQIGPEEYAALRRQYLPEGAVIQEGENLILLQAQGRLYAGETILLCASEGEDGMFCPEFLGDPEKAPAVLRSLQCVRGTFRRPGPGRDFAMYHPLTEGPVPGYFGLAFD